MRIHPVTLDKSRSTSGSISLAAPMEIIHFLLHLSLSEGLKDIFMPRDAESFP